MYFCTSVKNSQSRRSSCKRGAKWELLLIVMSFIYLCDGANVKSSKLLKDLMQSSDEDGKHMNNMNEEIMIDNDVRPNSNYEINTSTVNSYDFDGIIDDNLLNNKNRKIIGEIFLRNDKDDIKIQDNRQEYMENQRNSQTDILDRTISMNKFDKLNDPVKLYENTYRRKRNSVYLSSSFQTSTVSQDQLKAKDENFKTQSIKVNKNNLDKSHLDGIETTLPTNFFKNNNNNDILSEKLDNKKELEMDYQGDMPFERLPKIELLTNEVLSELNVKQILECKVPSNATMTAWYKNGKIMDMAAESSGNRLSVSKNGDAIIARVRKEDDGSWVCKGVDWLGNRISAEAVSLIVLETPSVPVFEVVGRPIDTSLPNRIVSVREGTELNATCSVLGGRPKPKIMWTFRKPNNLPIPDPETKDSNEEMLVEEKDANNGRLISIARVTIQKIHHNATLTCTMTHPTLATSLHSTVKIDVQYPPRFAISRVPGFGFPLAEGTPVSLRCEVESNPPSLPKWYKDDEEPPVPQTQDGFLNFTLLKREHSGWYKCTANHSFGVFSSIGYFLNVRYDVLDVTEEPEGIEKPTPGQVEVALGGAVQLQCPTGSIGCWGRWSGSRWTGAGSEAPHGALSLRGLLYQQAGQYRCEGLSRGTQGRLQVLREHTILVTGGPTVFPSNRTVLANEGSSAHLSAEFCANPTPIRVMWIAGNRIYKLGDMHGSIVVHNATNSTSPDCWMAELTVVPVGLQHSGEYSLLIRNAKGSTEAIFMLAVTASRSVTKSDSILDEWLRRNRSSKPFYYTQNYSLLCVAILWCSIKILIKIS